MAQKLLEGSTHFAELPSYDAATAIQFASSKFGKTKGYGGKGGDAKGGKGGAKGKGKGKQAVKPEPFQGQAAQH